MRFKLLVPPILTVSFLFAAFPAFSQTLPAYQNKALPLAIGFGPSSYDVDWGQGRMWGGTVWADWYPTFLPASLGGLGVEAEARDISLNKHLQPGNSDPERSGQGNTKQDTLGGGAIYSWRHFRNFHPYGKGLISLGSVDFISSSATYSHDTRTVISAGGGFEYRFFRQMWARADYEYQDWGTLLGTTLNPQGFTAGVAWDFSRPQP